MGQQGKVRTLEHRGSHPVLLWAMFVPRSVPYPLLYTCIPGHSFQYLPSFGFTWGSSKGKQWQGLREQKEEARVTFPFIPALCLLHISSLLDNPTEIPSSIRWLYLWGLVIPSPSFVPPAWDCSGFPLPLISTCFTGSCLAPQLLHLWHNHFHVLTSVYSNVEVASASLSGLTSIATPAYCAQVRKWALC